MRDVDAGVERGLEDVLALGGLDHLAVDRQFHAFPLKNSFKSKEAPENPPSPGASARPFAVLLGSTQSGCGEHCRVNPAEKDMWERLSPYDHSSSPASSMRAAAAFSPAMRPEFRQKPMVLPGMQ